MLSIVKAYHITGPLCKDNILVVNVGDTIISLLSSLVEKQDWRAETDTISSLLSCLHCVVLFDSIKVGAVTCNTHSDM